MHTITRSVDGDDDGVMDHSVNNSGGNDGIAQIIAEVFEVDVGGNDGRSLAVTAVDDFEEEECIASGFLFEAIEAYFVDEQDLGSEIGSPFSFEGVVGQTGQEVGEHGGGGSIAAAKALLTADKQEGLCDVAFAGTRASGEDHALLSLHKGERSQFHDLRFIHTGLEREVEVGKEFSLRQF